MSTAFAKLLYLHAITPVHSGTGQAAAIIDQPIAREKATGWPMIPASSLKGVLRDAHERKKTDELISSGKSFEDAKKMAEKDADKIYGDEISAGPVVFGDQRILCLPVRSFFGTFAYVTCPLILQRLKRDVDAIGLSLQFLSKIPENPPDPLTALLPEENSVLVSGKVYLEDMDLNVERRKEVGDIARGIATAVGLGINEFVSRFAIVSDEVFNFLSETATEIQARVALEDENKVVRKGGLWYEEAVPAEAVFVGPVLVADSYRQDRSELLKSFYNALQTKKEQEGNQKQEGTVNSQPIVIQIGGNASVGRGLCRVVMP
jgi:CRISPR-associated protein Cmr4